VHKVHENKNSVNIPTEFQLRKVAIPNSFIYATGCRTHI
jgi:hypothetical protein